MRQVLLVESRNEKLCDHEFIKQMAIWERARALEEQNRKDPY